MYRKFFKRCLDLVFAWIILILSAPLLLCIAAAVKLDSGGPVIFAQRRLGKDGKEFVMYKFRTMIPNAEAGGVYSDDRDPRVTKVGRLLRKTSLDEFPQLWNIIRGDMSFVGFRPPLTYHPWPWEEYTQAQKKMFSLRPGMTGWAQIQGRKTLPWQNRIEKNLWYTEHLSFYLDVKIIFLTFYKVLTNADNENIGVSLTGKAGDREIQPF